MVENKTIVLDLLGVDNSVTLITVTGLQIGTDIFCLSGVEASCNC